MDHLGGLRKVFINAGRLLGDGIIDYDTKRPPVMAYSVTAHIEYTVHIPFPVGEISHV